MSFSTNIGHQLNTEVEKELRYMDNEWFFKWYHIGDTQGVEIDSFDGRKIRYAGLAYSGSPELVYWDTISRYIKQKISEYFDFIEERLPKYPPKVQDMSIRDGVSILTYFGQAIRKKAVETDRKLRSKLLVGEIAKNQDQGRWHSSGFEAIKERGDVLLESYGTSRLKYGNDMPLRDLMTDTLTFMKKDGTVEKEGVKGSVQSDKVITFDVSLTVQPGDRFLRSLPNGLVEDYIVVDPGYNAGLGGHIPASYQSAVKRSDAPPAPAQTIINNIQGAHAKINIGSIDNSQNIIASGSDTKLFEEMLRALEEAKIPHDQTVDLRSKISELEAAQGTESFKKKYQDFMASAANHVSVFAPFLAGLAALL